MCIRDSFSSNYDADLYNSWFVGDYGYPFMQDHRGGRYLGTTPEIENIRPKSPKSSYNVDDMGSKISPSTTMIPPQNMSGMLNEDMYNPMSYSGSVQGGGGGSASKYNRGGGGGDRSGPGPSSGASIYQGGGGSGGMGGQMNQTLLFLLYKCQKTLTFLLR
eukprot:TRINITY_DN11428_c0_g1_i2.p1 TRINITY_DN11428_c0_g1~~TRINITY_DN11428_c0_g1_i2.p1  ORF type:complete len:188 (+),score=35.36 TRINITY_DN11428_c0_g1_i2:84-566(+)